MGKQKMKFSCSAATIAIYFLFTLLWMALFINASQEDNSKITDDLDNAMTQELLQKEIEIVRNNDADQDITKYGDYIQAIKQVVTIGKCPKTTIRIGMVMKVEKIDGDGNFWMSYGLDGRCCWVLKKDANKFVNLQPQVFPTGITRIDLQGDWVNSFSYYSRVKDTRYHLCGSISNQIEETKNEFILTVHGNEWVLSKTSETLTWKNKENRKMIWYRALPPTFKIKEQKKNDCSCSIL